MAVKFEEGEPHFDMTLNCFEDDGFMTIVRMFDGNDLVKTIYTIYKHLKHNENDGKFHVRYDYYSKEIGKYLKDSPCSVVVVDTNKLCDKSFVPEDEDKEYFKVVKDVYDDIQKHYGDEHYNFQSSLGSIYERTIELFEDQDYAARYIHYF